jgi:ABC-type transport system involved in multi-copper enzyme maturation permease subunit
MLNNPVLWLELRVRLREKKLWIISLIFLLSLAVIYFLPISFSREGGLVGEPAQLGMTFMSSLMVFLTVLLFILSPLAGAVGISQEREQRTLIGLLNTPLARHNIVLGKLLATWIYVLWLAVLALPFFAATLLWGGVSWGDWLPQFGMMLAVVLTASALALGMSGFFTRTLSSYLATGAALFLWCIAWPLLGSIFTQFYVPKGDKAADVRELIAYVFFYHNPGVVLKGLWGRGVEDPIYPFALAVWAAITALSFLLAVRGLKRGLFSK